MGEGCVALQAAGRPLNGAPPGASPNHNDPSVLTLRSTTQKPARQTRPLRHWWRKTRFFISRALPGLRSLAGTALDQSQGAFGLAVDARRAVYTCTGWPRVEHC